MEDLGGNIENAARNNDLNKIQLVIYDFDGVMTNNKLLIDQNGNEFVQVSRADGLGVSEIKKLGIDQIIISSEKNAVVSSRARKLGIECIQGTDDKKFSLINYLAAKDLNLANVAFLGNDINDLEVMEIVGISLCPKDAHTKIKKIAKIILKTKGGEGVIRELLELILNNFGNQNKI